MNYSPVDKDHLLHLIDFLYKEVISAGGDGDGLWYSKYYSVKDLLPLIKEYNNNLKFKWEIKNDENTINWGKNQEWLTITNNEDLYLKSPSWQQITIIY